MFCRSRVTKSYLLVLFCFISPGAFSDTLVIGNGADPRTLNPYQIETLPTYNIVKNLFEGLLEVSPDNQLLPAQAENWQVTPDGKTLTFKLRKGLKWSNGDKLTARDFVFAMQYAVDPQNALFRARTLVSAQVANASDIIAGKKAVSTLGVQAVDDLTLVIKLEQPIPFALRMLGRDTVPLHQRTIDKYGTHWALPGRIVSNGSYLLAAWTINEFVQLERNPRYWNERSASIKAVRFLPLSQEAELQRYLAGEIHITNGLPVSQQERLKKKFPKDIKSHLFFATQTYTFNISNKKVADKRVRKALSYAIDRELIAEKILKETGQPAYWFTPPGAVNFSDPNIALSQMSAEQRIKEAKALYKSAGYSDKNPLVITLLYNTSEEHKRVALAIADMWKKHLGVKATLNNQEFNSMVSDILGGNFDVARIGWTFMDQEPCLMMETFLTKHPFNNSRYKSNNFDQFYKQACTVINSSRGQLLAQAEQLLAEDVPAIPLFNPFYTRLVKPIVGGYPNNNQSANFYVKDLYFKKP